jgi:predicted dehydrogenase
LGGGAILDIGIYPAFLTYLLLGTPKDILAKSIFNEISKCDMQTSMIFNYDHAQAILYSGFTCNSVNTARINGTEGQIIIPNSWHAAQEYTLIKNEKEKMFKLPILGNGFSYEIMECHQCILTYKIESELWSHQNSLDLISILDTVRDSVGLVYPQEKN